MPMRRCIDTFTTFYKNKHQRRKLIWLFDHGTIEMQPTYLGKKYQVIANSFQATILTAFNRQDKYTVKELKEFT
jgi:hypothetical protein